LRGQKISTNAVLLVPPRLEEAISTEEEIRSEIWSSVEDLCAFVKKYQPDVIYMVSGYLLCLQDYMTHDQFKGFLEYCEKSGSILSTNDPMVGGLSRNVIKTGERTYATKPNPDLPARSQHLFKLLLAPFNLMHSYAHISPWVSEPDLLKTHTNIGFFNSRYADFIQSENAKLEFDGISDDKPFWLFTLGPEDYKDVLNEYGEQNFIKWTVDKVRFSLDQDRSVVVIGPSKFIDGLQAELGDTDNLSLHTYLPFHVFNRLNFAAEKVFFWNVLSASAMLRIQFGLPTFHFEIGHIGKSLKWTYEEFIKVALGGCKPLMIDQRDPFSVEVLDRLTNRFYDFKKTRTKQLSVLPEPDQVIRELVANKKIPVWAFWQSTEMPPLVSRCVASWHKHLDPEKYDIKILTHETFQQYLPFDMLSEIPHFFELRLAQQADFLRLSLLKWHGGIWMDMSIYLVDDLPFDGMRDQFYAPRFPRVDKQCVQAWLISTPRQNDVINAWLEEFTIQLKERRDIKLRFFSLSLYSGWFARIMRINDPKFKNYFLVYYAYEKLYRTQRWFRDKTPDQTVNGISSALEPENVKLIIHTTKYAFLLNMLRRFDPDMKWKITQKLVKRRTDFNKFLIQRDHLPTITMWKNDKVILYKLNATDRLLMKHDFDFETYSRACIN